MHQIRRVVSVTGGRSTRNERSRGCLIARTTPSDGELIGIRLTRAQLGQSARPGRYLLNAADGYLVTVTVPSLPRDTNQARPRRGIGKLAKSRGISDDDRIARAVPPDEAQVLQPPEVLAELLRGPPALA